MFKYKRSLVLMVAFLCLLPVFAQQVSFKATIDSTILLIGQQSKMRLEISGPASLNYTFPTFPGDTLVNGIEVLARGPLDTIEINKDLIRLQTDYLVTSFDSGLYYIPPIKILAGNDTVESNFMALKVITFDVDTAKVKIFDIKGVQEPPFVLSDYLLQILLFILVWGLVLLIIWLILRKKYGLFKGENQADLPLLPPHVVAIMELDRLKSEKIWKSGKNKEYYTELSDILRKYIERRFQINALEMTTDEILVLFKRDKTTQSVYQNLRQILQLSDLVKFAKILPLENENELSIMNSYLFVNQTKIEEVKPLEEQIEATQEGQNEAAADDNISEEVSEIDVMKKYQPK
jgi:hypothetical protein